MDPERWERIKSIYHDALELPAEQRSSFLDRECDGDAGIRREIESLIAANDQAGDFIVSTALKDAARIMASDNPDSFIDRTIGNYRIVAHLGSGGMGDVFRARDLRLGRDVAIKTIPPEFSRDEERLRRFEIEARAAASLNHPNISTLYSVEKDDGMNFITMEYVEGQPLREMIPPGGLHLDTFLRWFTQIADGLTHAHERGVIHRDIKPANILINNQGVPKILDFGLARVNIPGPEHTPGSETLSLTTEGVVLGTPAYMSPEQAEGKEVDQRSDIFSFGILMYEALTARKPFQGDSFAALMSSILKEEPVSVTEIRNGIPMMLVRLIKRCLSKSRQHRYQTMREVRTVLDEIKADYDANPADISYSSLFRNFRASRGKKRFLVPAIAFGLLTLIAGWYFISRYLPDEPLPISVVIRPPAGIQPFLTESRISPDGRTIAFSAISNDTRQLWLQSIDEFEARPLQGTDGARDPFFSPDSTWLAYFLENGALKKIPLAGGTPLTIAEAGQVIGAADWGEKDEIVFSAREGLALVSATTGRTRQLTKLDESNGHRAHRYPRFLPDGDRVMFTVVRDAENLAAVVDLSEGRIRLLEDLGAASYAQYLESGHVIFARGKELLVAPFDVDGLRLKDAPTPVMGGMFFMANLQVSDNGTLVYLPDTLMNNNSLVWVDRAGQARPALPQNANFRSPKISHDGKRYAVAVGDDIWVYEIETGRGLRLTFDGENMSPVWSPDDKMIAYGSNSGGNWTLNLVPADHSDAPRVIATRDQRILPYAWHSRDSVLAVVYSVKSENTDIGLVSTTDKDLQPIFNAGYIEDVPDFSPDGTWLAYFSNETGRVEVYATSYPDRSQRMPVSREGGMYPRWSRDGREIFFRRGARLYTVPVTSGTKLTVGTPRVLFEGRYLTGFDVTSDGSRFLMVRNESGTLPNDVHLIVNWASRIESLIGKGK